ncbi:hypothetical protein ABB37_09123 [Leptomonas pyrrhocoris]|uniref:Uncharacterized protein n=1 Tax=Leptomonas pyrrhocoris TaxID=157538 RepID=A0A0M9FRG2_LEPPY|nr:hypothetical protein ABB37_09123 [Leptomonas pyrrhocoris]XP_015652868.1 hypothetical protein ABB37_09123 [Leptomonas pyrrhocoris]KPA74428.1 hypothetical protein ABB37_09123 [Leptomonas pyrrhocoris]KPA74429.1 hypothetical protein ABB37_09123 [Leptomonas pyrrhocoris]|eukprot:XP_015652867.1 hypothetical protein ABB37_09123 [Leptomonas pyrrhocoris]
MNSRVVQIPVRKQGAWEKGHWSTRILTIDVASGTLTISRCHHPKNILYHSIQLESVQMWPHFVQRDLEEYINSIQAKMTVRFVGTVVPVPDFSRREAVTCGRAAVTATAGVAEAQPPSRDSTPPSVTLLSDPSSTASDFLFIAGDGTKKPRTVEKVLGRASEVWMIRFTTFQSYVLALRLVYAMKNAEGQRKQLLGSTAEHDLEVIQQEWTNAGGASGIHAEMRLV